MSKRLLAFQHLYPNQFITLYVRPTTLSELETELAAYVECRVMMRSTVSDLSVLYSWLETCLISGFSRTGKKDQNSWEIYAVLAAINFVLANLHLSLFESLQSWKQSWKTFLVRILPKRGESIVLWCIHLITFSDDKWILGSSPTYCSHIIAFPSASVSSSL